MGLGTGRAGEGLGIHNTSIRPARWDKVGLSGVG